MNPAPLRQLPLGDRLIVPLATVTFLFAGMIVTPRSAQPVEASAAPQQGLGATVLVRDGIDLRICLYDPCFVRNDGVYSRVYGYGAYGSQMGTVQVYGSSRERV